MARFGGRIFRVRNRPDCDARHRQMQSVMLVFGRCTGPRRPAQVTLADAPEGDCSVFQAKRRVFTALKEYLFRNSSIYFNLTTIELAFPNEAKVFRGNELLRAGSDDYAAEINHSLACATCEPAVGLSSSRATAASPEAARRDCAAVSRGGREAEGLECRDVAASIATEGMLQRRLSEHRVA